jgi:lipopolysaccharide transport system permease protein
MNVAVSECAEVPQLSDNDASQEGVLREGWRYRELFYFLAWRDVKVRYKQTALGALWAVIQPLFTMVVFTLLFGQLANIPSDGVPRPVFYFTALVPWTYLSTTVNAAGMSLVANAGLLTKIYFPRVILPASAALSGLLDFLIGSAFLAAFVVYYRIPVGWNLLLWPLLVVLLFALALSVGMFLAALNVRFRDVKYAIPFGIQLWLFVSPIIYPSSMIPERYQWLLALNPVTGLIEAFRYALVPTLPIHWDLLAISAVMTSLLFIGGLVCFKRTERVFADII